jgi:cobalt-precorrin-5B (C1)-methyltransferase
VHIAATTGNSSEDAIKRYYQLDDMALIEMGDFAGAVLKHLKKVSVKKLTICGGIGKISKLANGHMDLNSRVSEIDFMHLASVASEMGGDKSLLTEIQGANTSVQALQLCQAKNIDLAGALCDRALVVAKNIVPRDVEVEVIAIDRKGQFVGSTSPEIMAGLG